MFILLESVGKALECHLVFVGWCACA